MQEEFGKWEMFFAMLGTFVISLAPFAVAQIQEMLK